jgi:cell division protein FtsB
MSKFFHLTKRKRRKIQRKRRLLMKVDIKTANIVIGLLIVVIGVSYLVQINGLATKGYQIKELEDRIAELSQDQADLELVALSLQSMGAVKDKVEDLGMVAVGENEYLIPTPVVVAR